MANKILYKDLNSTDKIKAEIDWTSWLGTSTISTSTWAAQDDYGSTTSALTVSDDSHASGVTECYVTGGSQNEEYWLVNTIVTGDAIPRTESRSIELHCVRKLV